ncbi:MBL fold metallo-hydrolase [Clostridium tagluense]|uniref:MBL fold metallo-hydrolase n=1 Tax=Clostridium TaxID=1485 RepID=UPI0013E907FE|nr:MULTISPECIES: MBL fold metallo-hydrolase [Clostridium]MBW9156496.1 MBL fold metallo-hydrolase [Clostridium tagluense]MBZ9624217.1 MBL fold metallo-hydrolase [Clostridium sp. FP2]MBZ9635719.1 MBL fold metallo-hydrolase [Clostridium sp. FP1]MCB2300475.1 MBL fold metallo-hydrolase [Clostridium tagluense]MCB2309749.1 MBL fold metallo-hydrolase [Clostridium tagluense]
MEIKRLITGIYGSNCYIVMDETTKEAVVLDPGGDVDDITRAIDIMGAKVTYILLTHGHLDHTTGVAQLKAITNATVCISKADDDLITKGEYLFGPLIEGGADKLLKQWDVIKISNLEFTCLDTPGHTPGGMCFKVENCVFTGDTLFAGSIGRTDFAGGDFNTIIMSIKLKLLCLPESTIVYPGHGPSSTINNEKLSNPFLQD